MQNAGIAFGVLTRISNWVYFKSEISETQEDLH